MMKNTLVIEALSLNYGRLFGFQEYLFNILEYFKINRKRINAKRIIVVCKECDRFAFNSFVPEMDIVSFDTKNIVHRYYILNTLHKLLHLSKDDVILFTNNYSALTKHCKYVTVVHDLLYLRKKYISNWAFRIQRKIFVPRSVKIADKVISISKWVKQDVEEQFGVEEKNKVIAIYNYFDFEKFCRDKPNLKIIELCKGRDFFLVVCSTAAHKNTITILKAYKKYIEQGGTKDLLVLGGIGGFLNDFVSKLKYQIREKIISISGISNADLGYLYQHASAYISATLFEGLGMPIVEAMFFGIPCHVSDIPIVREVTNGMASYFPPTDVDALLSLMSNPAVKANPYSTTIIKQMYSAENTVKRYIDDVLNPLLL